MPAFDPVVTACTVLAPIIEKFGPHKRLVLQSGSTFASLSRSIVYQQLAGSAADAIFKRVLLKCEVCHEAKLQNHQATHRETLSLRFTAAPTWCCALSCADGSTTTAFSVMGSCLPLRCSPWRMRSCEVVGCLTTRCVMFECHRPVNTTGPHLRTPIPDSKRPFLSLAAEDVVLLCARTVCACFTGVVCLVARAAFQRRPPL